MRGAVLLDFFGRRALLTEEGWAHIVGRRPYMADFRPEIAETLGGPDEIRRSSSVPETASLYYKWYYGTAVGDKGLGVVVKILPAEAFVVTAYCTGRIKEGERLWPS